MDILVRTRRCCKAQNLLQPIYRWSFPLWLQLQLNKLQPQIVLPVVSVGNAGNGYCNAGNGICNAAAKSITARDYDPYATTCVIVFSYLGPDHVLLTYLWLSDLKALSMHAVKGVGLMKGLKCSNPRSSRPAMSSAIGCGLSRQGSITFSCKNWQFRVISSRVPAHKLNSGKMVHIVSNARDYDLNRGLPTIFYSENVSHHEHVMSDGLTISPRRLWNANPLRKNEERTNESPLCHYHVKLRHGCLFAVICYNSLISELVKLSNMKKRLISSKHITINPSNHMVAEEKKFRCKTHLIQFYLVRAFDTSDFQWTNSTW